MKKVFLEIFFSLTFVAVATFLMYGQLVGVSDFWNAQNVWSIILACGWVVVSLGYYHQGYVVHKSKSAEHVSIVLPGAVFIVQCILFVKGIYYDDWALIFGALVVNSGVIFSLYQITHVKFR